MPPLVFGLPGVRPRQTKAVTQSYYASWGDALLVDSSLAALSVFLPPPLADQRVVVKKVSSDGNNVTITAPTGRLIDGAATLVISAQWASKTLISDGSAWYTV